MTKAGATHTNLECKAQKEIRAQRHKSPRDMTVQLDALKVKMDKAYNNRKKTSSIVDAQAAVVIANTSINHSCESTLTADSDEEVSLKRKYASDDDADEYFKTVAPTGLLHTDRSKGSPQLNYDSSDSFEQEYAITKQKSRVVSARKFVDALASPLWSSESTLDALLEFKGAMQQQYSSIEKHNKTPRDYLMSAGLRRSFLKGKPLEVCSFLEDQLKVCNSSSITKIYSALTAVPKCSVSTKLSTTSHRYTTCRQSRIKLISSSHKHSKLLVTKKKAIQRLHIVTCAPTSQALLAKPTSANYDSIIDTGASTHIVREPYFASNTYHFRPSKSLVALGDHALQLTALGTCDVALLRNALYVPKMSLNLVSGSALERDGFSLTVKDAKCNILNHKGDIVFTAPLRDGLYCFQMSDFIKQCTNQRTSDMSMVAKVKKPTTIATPLDIELLHKRFGHASTEDVVTGLKNGTITGFTVSAKRHNGAYQLQNGVCTTCMKAKSHKPPFYMSLSVKAAAPGAYVVCDIQGPFSVETLGGHRYVVTYTDWYSRYSWTHLLLAKNEALSKLKHLVEVVFKAYRVSLRHYHSDQAGELQGSDTLNYLEKVVHATHSESEAYTPARNAIAERKFRTLSEMTAAMLFDSGLPKSFWGYAYLAATHIRNRIPTVVRGSIPKPRTPYELWHNTVPNMHYIRRWGCKCFVHVPKQLRDKSFPDKALTGYLVGFTSEGSYRVYIPESGKVVGPTVQIQFDENIPSHSESYFNELHIRDGVIDTTDKLKPLAPKDFHYLIGTTHVDDEDKLLYETTRITTVNKDIVAYRAPVNSDGKRNRYEDTTPIHVKDIARLTKLSPSSDTVAKTTTGEGIPNTCVGKLAAFKPHSRPYDEETLSESAATEHTNTPNHDISTGHSDPLLPRCATERSSSYNLRKRVTFDLLSESERKLRRTSAVNTRGHVASQVEEAKSSGRTEPTSTFRAFHTMVERNEFEIDFVPTTYKQAMQSHDSMHWQQAIDKELNSIASNNVFSIVDKPPGVQLQTGRFLFKIKYTGQSTIYKARLIAHGFKQIAGTDYWETYAPVSSCISTRIFLTLCATFKMIIHQMDIDTAFLIAELTEDLYMAPPIGMTVPEGKVLKLHKCLYGLKQSPRYFNQHLVNTLLRLGFENLINEPCLFHKMVDGTKVIATIYVDDILIACNNVEIIKSIKLLLAETYKMKDMGEMDWYLGMRCKRDKTTGSITLDQTKYIDDVLTKFDEWSGSRRNRYIPMEANVVLQKWTQEYDNSLKPEDADLIQRFPYRQIIGSLLYISIWTRPDISFAIGKLAKFNNHPTTQAIHATQWLMQYLSCTKHIGLTFIAGDMRISTYVDSSFGDVVIDKRSTAGQITFLGKSPIQWDSFVCDNYAIPCSVAEAEYIAASEAARVMLSNRNILSQLGFPQHQMLMFEDNEACISIAMQESSNRKTKHVELQVHHIRDLVKSGKIAMIHITTNIQLADIFTKPLNVEVFNRHLPVILGNEPTGDLLTFLTATKEFNTSVDR